MASNQNEARDYRGRWTNGGPSDAPEVADIPKYDNLGLTPEEKSRFQELSDKMDAGKATEDELKEQEGLWQKNLKSAGPFMDKARELAQKFDFPPSMVDGDLQKKEFEVNGKNFTEGGHYRHDTGRITVRPNQSVNDSRLNELMTHEVFHAKYFAYLDDVGAEKRAMQADPDYMKQDKWVPDPSVEHDDSRAKVTRVDENGNTVYLRRELGFMRPDGLLNAPYDKKYPLYQDNARLTSYDAEKKREKTDGVSGYSRAYWEGVDAKPPTVAHMTATTETLSEIAAWREAHHVPEGKWTAPKILGISADIAHAIQHKNVRLLNTEAISPEYVKQDIRLWKPNKSPSKEWRDLYDAVENNWQKNHNPKNRKVMP